ncbi:MAG: sigma-70 family RNA polymerase sigma factor [Candidatus Omnitrophica bacterium]|nr:sigma-70 family RNA polymerase sigma factor [Candidatus Omnitrophota bacterium]MCM8806346.1 sigma-70 family RNA polymerase sigma factor [Candidatus Omnitrophota bacterium]
MDINVENYFPLVRKILKRYETMIGNLGIEKEDLFQEGCLGLIEARKNYKDNMKVPFSKYAYFWIKKNIIQSIENFKRQKRKPGFSQIKFKNYSLNHDFDNKFTVLNLTGLLEIEKLIIEKFFIEGKTIKEISKEIGISKEKTKQIKQRAIRKLKNINKKLTIHSMSFNREEVSIY